MSNHSLGFKRRSMSLALLSFSAGAALVGGGNAQAASWQSTATRAYPVNGVSAAGALADDTKLHLAVALKMRDRTGLDAFLARTAVLGDRDYGRSLSTEEFTAQYAPSSRQADAVVDYLTRAGFTHIEVAPNRLLISADASARAVRSAFNTEITQFRAADGRGFYANTRPAQVPSELADTVLAVAGLQTADHPMSLAVHRDASTDATVHPFNPTEFALAYNGSKAYTGKKVQAGVIVSGDLTQTLADLAQFESQNGITPPPVKTVVIGTPSSDTSGTIEWDLDTQDILGIAGTIKGFMLYDTPSLSDADLEAAYNRAVTDNKVQAINVSLGICEQSEFSSGAMAATDQIFAAAAAQGQTFFVSSGDGGSHTGCIAHTGIAVAVSYPASSPYVVAVGGTTLYVDSKGKYSSETAWKSGGGGISKYEAAPSWQSALTGQSMRLVPDIAMAGDPNSGATIVANGSSTTYGGTSLAAPLSTGVWTRELSYAKSQGLTLGFAAPVIYSQYASTPTTFHDVTTGNNGAYTAGPGFDETTGVGSFDIQVAVYGN